MTTYRAIVRPILHTYSKKQTQYQTYTEVYFEVIYTVDSKRLNWSTNLFILILDSMVLQHGCSETNKSRKGIWGHQDRSGAAGYNYC